jgi:hypothetical protein
VCVAVLLVAVYLDNWEFAASEMFHKTFVSGSLGGQHNFCASPCSYNMCAVGTQMCTSGLSFKHTYNNNRRTCYNNIDIKKSSQIKKSLTRELLETVLLH